ncbi:LysR family transcriptional regulator, regulator for metE and metH [Tistlia consotensis]|uniref:LysR family transcriptional regulator, regulator for metE and metH n=1 Tax=Tistlia consotensis USBA 355 TaxID=560819 RepID=A0A1Y6CBJ9_9PROT|nr:LysR family transcriptional regulator [Tistlia consotensis]SMF53602.1 LysR family transcriptional regulator, regulator for metE and metH [Tistlia consotensis USBA 355]SNR85749.1 LysR family transcriptional regulator, regulator for metE and metH [Tistlia consotensis]
MAEAPLLELRHLLVLIAIVETGGVTAAALRLGLTQSAVTHRVREAERRLQRRLFSRSGKRLLLTPAGERLLQSAQRVVEELGRAEQELRPSAGGVRELVRLGQATYSRYHWLPRFLEDFGDRSPGIEVDLVARATHSPFAALAEGAVDVALVYGSRSEQRGSWGGGFRWRHIASDPLVVIVAPGHRLAALPWLSSREMADERYFAYPLSSEPGYSWDTVAGPPPVPFRRVSQVQLPEAVIDLVRAGFGCAIFSRWAVEPEVADGSLLAKPLGPEGFSLDWWAVTRAAEPEDGPAGRLADFFVDYARRPDRGLANLGFGGSG